MKRIILIFVSLLLILTGCTSEKHSLPDLTILGDVEQVLKLNDIWESQNTQTINYNNTKIKAMSTNELLQSISLLYQHNDIYLRAVDGFTIKLNDESLSDTYLGYSNEKKWVFVSEKHPVNSGIKNICEMIIVKNTDENNYDFGLNIVYENNTLHYSTGELLTKPYQVKYFSDGVSKKTVNGEVYEVDVMQQRRVLSINDLVDIDTRNVLIMDRQGEYDYAASTGLIEISDRGINYISQGKTYRDIIGIMLNPPQTTVMDTYDDTLYYLKKNQDVMVLFIDGFSYTQYQNLLANNKELFITRLDNVKIANTVYKPVTNAGFAAMITGQPPKINGVPNRDYRELKVPTIFEKAKELGKKAILIEGDINILNTQLTPQLNLDSNNNGTKDDEIFKNALAEINNDYDLFFVHFHSVDDFGHSYGDLSNKTLNTIAVIDGYIKELVAKWQGKVIIVSDHGMHKTDMGGSHGEFRAEDLYVPYAIIDGGKG